MLRREVLCMRISDKDRADHVRSAKTWLEKAEQSFDRQAGIKGELNLMLAEAEMKNLRKKRTIGQKFLKVGAILTAFVLAAGFWYIFTPRNQSEPMTPITATSNKAERINSQWVSMPKLNYSEDTSAVKHMEGAVTHTRINTTSQETGSEESDSHIKETMQESPQIVVQPSESSHGTTVMTDRQVQKAVQDAQHSLRGK